MINYKPNVAILADLDKVVYGHREAKVALINLVNRSKMRHYQKHVRNVPEQDLISTINCMLIGDSGTGKTHLIKSLSKLCTFPLVIIDANQLAPTNAQEGLSVDKLIKLLGRKANELLNDYPDIYFSKEGILDQMIVFIDEFDKLAKPFDSSGNWNKHVQANFLTIIENNTELTGLSFIFAGAFGEMKMRVADSKPSIGFNTAVHESEDKEFDVEQEVIKYGIIPELLGRINNIVVLDKLKEDDFRRILAELVLPKIQKELKSFNIHSFSLIETEITSIIKKALQSKMGVRTLAKEVLKLAQDLEFDYEWYDEEEPELLEHWDADFEEDK